MWVGWGALGGGMLQYIRDLGVDSAMSDFEPEYFFLTLFQSHLLYFTIPAPLPCSKVIKVRKDDSVEKLGNDDPAQGLVALPFPPFHHVMINLKPG